MLCSCKQPKSLVQLIEHLVKLSGGVHAVPIVKLSLLGGEQHRFFSHYLKLASLCPSDASADYHAGPKPEPAPESAADDAKLGPDSAAVSATDGGSDAETKRGPDAAAGSTSDGSSDGETKLCPDSNSDCSSEILHALHWLVREEHFKPGGMPIGVGAPWPGFVRFRPRIKFVKPTWLLPVLWFSVLQLRLK